METKEIIIISFSVLMTALAFPYIIKAADYCGERFCDAIASAVNTYKEDWQDCIKKVKRWLFNGRS